MTRQEYVLAVLAAGNGQPHNAVQVQKLFFLLDRKVPDQVSGPWFHFERDAFGPFDKAVFEELQSLAACGLVCLVKINGSPVRHYQLTETGLAEGQKHLATLPVATADYIRRLSAWVRGLSFTALMAAIYRDYPEMRIGSVFGGAP